MTGGIALRERIREKNCLPQDAAVGVVATFGTKQWEEGDRTLAVIATTDDIDLDTEVVVPGGADPSYFRKNAKIFLDHNYDFDSCVGVLRTVTPYPTLSNLKGWKVRFHVSAKGKYGDDILTLHREAGVGVSIGFQALEYGKPSAEEKALYGKGGAVPASVIRRWKWLELSVTAMPCNVSCQSMGGGSVDESKMAAVDRLLTKGLIKPWTAKAFGLKLTPRLVLKCAV